MESPLVAYVPQIGYMKVGGETHLFKFSTDVEEIEMFEIAKRIAVEQDKNGNHFRIAHSSLSIASFRGVRRGI